MPCEYEKNNLIKFILNEAEERRLAAGYNGSYDDGGASKLEEQVAIFNAGWNREYPEAWKKLIKQFHMENDSEYQTYLRLKEKFT